jgi:hypothetical protein
LLILDLVGRRWLILGLVGRRWLILDLVGRRWLILDLVGRRWPTRRTYFSATDIARFAWSANLSQVASTSVHWRFH